MQETDQEAELYDFIRKACIQVPQIEQAILFGSRAKKNAHERSDYDVAIVAPDLRREDWAHFAAELREGFPSLCGIDLVLVNEDLAATLSESIRQEGKLIYVRK